ncbi:hypothetical protein Nepgr_005363 [Nepenthes gracilis]|uniref:Uncharacterized protein n=1 Tax=Nepenthes gracilis TaxID=150966 RepID=A0AAD3XG86_NEPGR|nr:hypothetical protein Nepgr_005363 [Nepenthes gracilis]
MEPGLDVEGFSACWWIALSRKLCWLGGSRFVAETLDSDAGSGPNCCGCTPIVRGLAVGSVTPLQLAILLVVPERFLCELLVIAFGLGLRGSEIPLGLCFLLGYVSDAGVAVEDAGRMEHDAGIGSCHWLLLFYGTPRLLMLHGAIWWGGANVHGAIWWMLHV